MFLCEIVIVFRKGSFVSVVDCQMCFMRGAVNFEWVILIWIRVSTWYVVSQKSWFDDCNLGVVGRGDDYGFV